MIFAALSLHTFQETPSRAFSSSSAAQGLAQWRADGSHPEAPALWESRTPGTHWSLGFRRQSWSMLDCEPLGLAQKINYKTGGSLTSRTVREFPSLVPPSTGAAVMGRAEPLQWAAAQQCQHRSSSTSASPLHPPCGYAQTFSAKEQQLFSTSGVQKISFYYFCTSPCASWTDFAQCCKTEALLKYKPQ